MSRDSGSGDPSQRTVAELLAEHGGGSQRGTRRRRRRAEDPTETAPQAIIERVNSDSGRLRPVVDEEEPPAGSQPRGSSTAAPAAGVGPPPQPPPEPPQTAQPPQAQPQQGAPAPQPPQAQPQQGGPAAQTTEPPQAPPTPEPPPAAAPTGPAQTDGPDSSTGQPPTSMGPATGGADYWARRFAEAAGSGTAPKNAGEALPDESEATPEQDPEATAQQLPLAAPAQVSSAPAQPAPGFARGPAPNAPSAPAPPPEGQTEQFPVPDSPAWSAGEALPHDSAEDTTLLAYQDPDGLYGEPAVEAAPPYEPAYYDEAYEDGYDNGLGDAYDVADYPEYDYADDLYADVEDDQLPAGMAADDARDDTAGGERETPPRGPFKEWLLLVLQVGAGLVTGGAVWFGFQWLWTAIPVAALVAALVVTGVLVLVARKILRTDDLQTILLAVLVGLVCTVSPAALLLVGY